MEHLALEVFDLSTKENPKPTGSKYAVLEPDATITITDTSEIFADGDVWSYGFTLNVRANAHLFGTAGDIHGSRLHEQLNKRKARLWVEGTPLYLGYLKLDDEAEVDAEGNVDVTFESGQKTFEEMIEGTSAQEVSVGDVVIGVALNRKRLLKITHIKGTFKPQIYRGGTFGGSRTGDGGTVVDKNPILEFKGSMSDFSPYTHRWPKLVLSKGVLNNLATGASGEQVNYTNVQEAYSDEHPFCNINICYQRKHKKNTSDPNSEDVTDRGYIVRLAYGKDTTLGGDDETRFNNSPNFYLIHWLNRLFKDLGIHIEENQMLGVEDLKRVFLANLGCFYEEKDTNNDVLENYTQGSADWQRYGKYSFPTNFIHKNHTFFQGDEDQHKVLIHRIESERFGSHNSLKGEILSIDYDSLSVEETGIDGYLAYATGENYPNVEISEIIRAAESAFGVRFLFSNDFTRVRIVLLRNIFNDTSIQNLDCDVISERKQENSVRGFKMTYGGDKSDTTFFYKGFDDMLPKKKEIWVDDSDKHDYSQWKLNSEYADILTRVTSFNKTCYVTPVNGDAYGVKIDENEDIFYPSLFEYAGYMDAEDGDCTGDEETIKTVTVNAKPLIMNDADGVYAVFHNGDMKAPGITQVAALIPVLENEPVDIPVQWDTMPAHGSGGGSIVHHEEIAKAWVDIFLKEGYQATLYDNYSFTGNDGTSFDKADIGLCFGIMRGSGDDSYIKYEDDKIENEDPINQWWEVVPGSGAVCHPDTCNEYGDEWDYNGEAEGIGDTDGRVSLKLRAEKPNPYFNPNQEENDTTNRRYLEITSQNLRQRGLCDKFYKAYSYWVRNARIAVIETRMTVAQYLAIDTTKKISVGDITGLIRKRQFTVRNDTGMGNVTMEIMYI